MLLHVPCYMLHVTCYMLHATCAAHYHDHRHVTTTSECCTQAVAAESSGHCITHAVITTTAIHVELYSVGIIVSYKL